MTRTRALGTGTVAALLALTLAACTDDSDPSATGSSSSSGSSNSSSSQSETPLKDRSGQVFDAAKEPEPLGSATGSVNIGIGSTPAKDVTFEVTDVTAATDATILRYQLTAAKGTEYLGMEGRFWYDQPTLQVPGSDTRLQSVTGSVPEGQRDRAQERCVCTSIRFAGPDPRSQTTMYPPLPEDATEVDVTLDGLDPVTVPISR